MPYMQAMTSAANMTFEYSRLRDVRAIVMSPQNPMTESAGLGDIAAGFGISVSQAATAFLNTCPRGIAQAIKAAVRSALNDDIAITWSWMPAYDWELSVSESAGTRDSKGGMTILIKSRYPADDFPDGVQPR